VSRLLDENTSASGATNMNHASSSSDLESGLWELSNSKLKPMLKARIHSGKRQLGSLLQQLDHIFVTGALFLKRNASAKWWALMYLVCLHFWVFYILSSHTSPSNVGRSGAQISLENINNTGGVWLCCNVSFICVIHCGFYYQKNQTSAVDMQASPHSDQKNTGLHSFLFRWTKSLWLCETSLDLEGIHQRSNILLFVLTHWWQFVVLTQLK